MSVIIKSNQKATKSLGDIFGIKGPRDYSVLLDFNQQIYLQKTGETKRLSFAEAVSFKRASKATYLDETNTLRVAEINEPRIHYDKRTEKKGLLIEPSHTELLSNIYTPATQTIAVTHSTADRLMLSVKGSGSATISGVVSSTTNEFTATEDNPVMLATTGSGDVTVTVSGSLEVFSLHKIYATQGSYPFMFPPLGVTATSADNASLNADLFAQALAGKTQCTVVMHVKEAKRPTAANTYNNRQNVFTLWNTQASNNGIYLTRTTGNSSRFNSVFLGTVDNTPIKNTTKENANSNYDHTYVLSYSDSGASAMVARNGEVTVVDGDFTVSPTTLLIGSPSTYIAGSAVGGIITAIVIYPYKMTYAQVQELSKTFN